MNYDIRITGDTADAAELDKIVAIAKSTKDIAEKALMLKVYGYSGISLPAAVRERMKIRIEKLTTNDGNGVHLLLDADNFGALLPYIETDIFRPELVYELQQLTPMALVIRTFRTALQKDGGGAELDKPILKALLQFRKSFTSDKEVFHFSNRQSVPEVEVRLEDFRQISTLDKAIPQPHKAVVMGRLDEMKFTKEKLVLVTANGAVTVLIKDQDAATRERLKDFWGRDITVQGIANYRTDGKLSFVHLQQFGESSVADRYFSKVPTATNARQQLLFQIQRGSARNPLRQIAGQWPGDESDAEFQRILKDAH